MDTSRALIDVEMVEHILRFNNEKVVFNEVEAIKHQSKNSQCYWVHIVEDTIKEMSQGKSS